MEFGVWYVGKMITNDVLGNDFKKGDKIYFKRIKMRPKRRAKQLERFGREFVKEQERAMWIFKPGLVGQQGMAYLPWDMFRKAVKFKRNGELVQAKNQDRINQVYEEKRQPR